MTTRGATKTAGKGNATPGRKAIVYDHCRVAMKCVINHNPTQLLPRTKPLLRLVGAKPVASETDYDEPRPVTVDARFIEQIKLHYDLMGQFLAHLN